MGRELPNRFWTDHGGIRLEMENNVWLIGFMASGKSTIGRRLASELECSFVDLDVRIEQQAGRTIPELFSVGEEHFRLIEAEALRRTAEGEGQVIATGGGIVNLRENRDVLRHCAKNGDAVIWLRVDGSEVLCRALGSVRRPLLETDEPEVTVKRLLAIRDPLYREVSSYVIDTTGRTIADICDELLTQLRK